MKDSSIYSSIEEIEHLGHDSNSGKKGSKTALWRKSSESLHWEISMRSLIWLKGILQQESHTTSSQQSFHQQSDTRSLIPGGPLLVINRLLKTLQVALELVNCGYNPYQLRCGPLLVTGILGPPCAVEIGCLPLFHDKLFTQPEVLVHRHVPKLCGPMVSL